MGNLRHCPARLARVSFDIDLEERKLCLNGYMPHCGHTSIATDRRLVTVSVVVTGCSLLEPGPNN